MRTLTDPHGWFTLEIPDGWQSETKDGVTTLHDPTGVGVVYVSGGRHARGRQASFGRADFLRRFLESIGIHAEADAIDSTERAGCRIYSYQRDNDDAYWRYWSVTDDETALLISYRCAAADASTELDDVNGIVRSVRLYHSAPLH
jgi:hypothetical protein